MSVNTAEIKALRSINSILEQSGKNINDYKLVPFNLSVGEDERLATMISEEIRNVSADMNILSTITLNDEQQEAYDTILRKVFNEESGMFFIDGPGGTGKTYLYKALLAAVRSKNLIALATASSGVAAALLPGGRTAHSRLGIRSLVLESSDHLRITRFALIMCTNACRILDALGIGDYLKTKSVQIHGGNSESKCVKRKDMLETIEKELPKRTIRYSFKVVSIEESRNFKLVHLAYGSVVKTKVFIQCDGVNSMVAKWLGLQNLDGGGLTAIRGYPNGHGFEVKFHAYFGGRFRYEKCNVFVGNWVQDPTSPFYTNATCSIIEDHQNCIRNGRPDTDYIYWRWKPRDYNLPKFDPKKFLNMMRDKSLAFIGDSIMRNHVQSLLCMLSQINLTAAVLLAHTATYNSRGTDKDRDNHQSSSENQRKPKLNKMDEKFKLIPDIYPTQRDWTTKVIVTEKLAPKIAKQNQSRYQHMILMDLKGNKVQATLYDANINAFEDQLILGKTYLISNANLGEKQWTITGRTRIEELPEDNMALIFSTYEFTAFDELEKFMDSNKDISIIALCIDMKPKRLIQTRSGNQTYVQDIILINKSFQTMMLTMWDSYVDRECVLIAENIANKPVIVASHLKVSSFNGITLSTKTNSNFFINATFNEVAEYKAWVSNANLGETYECVYCKCSQTKAVPRAKVYVQLEDSTGVLNANVIGEPAEKLLHCSSETLMQHSKRSTTNIHDAIQMADDKEQIFYVKATQGLINKTEYKFEIIFVLDTCLVITQIEHSKVDKGKGLLYPDLPTEPTLIEEVCSSY
ncbi:FAD binding 3 domain-containing protein [Abeliophyllum distichum]|uniref:ATP-dependent DNA helicase n=1 Tax=Abeliophyllum distichum TaxID=126358 RepID=A0ABD1NW17_9LAMI